jgi:hypothetical protein
MSKNVTAFPLMKVQLLLLISILGPVSTNLLVNCKRSGPGIAADPFSKLRLHMSEVTIKQLSWLDQ